MGAKTPPSGTPLAVEGILERVAIVVGVGVGVRVGVGVAEGLVSADGVEVKAGKELAP